LAAALFILGWPRQTTRRRPTEVGAMQVTQKSGEGLSRVYGVTVGVEELGAKLEAKIAEIAPRLNLRGFRPGKVPVAHVKRIYGKALMGEVVEQTIDETSKQVLEDNGLRVAAQPDLKPQSNMEEVIAGKEDLAYELNVEVMPDFEPIDAAGLEIERPVYSATSPSRAAPMSPGAARAPRPRTATRSPSISSAASTARPSKAARPRTPSWCWAPASSSRGSKNSWSAPRPATRSRSR
jgi:hypothetical protein